jgi:hypothetical protein
MDYVAPDRPLSRQRSLYTLSHLRTTDRGGRRAGTHPWKERSERVAQSNGAVAGRAQVVRCGATLARCAHPRRGVYERSARCLSAFGGRAGSMAPPFPDVPSPAHFRWSVGGGAGLAWLCPAEVASRTIRAGRQPRSRGDLGLLAPAEIDDGLFRPVPFVLFAFAGAILFTWVYNSTNESVLLIILFHTSVNAIGGTFFFSMFSGADLTRLWWLQAAVYCAAAIVVVIVAGPAHLSRKHAKQ